MAVIYSDYARDRIGWFFGVSGWQLGVLAAAVAPLLWAINARAWPAAGAFLGLWVVVAVVTVVPVRGRSATGWLIAATCYAVGAAVGWTRFRSRAATGAVDDLEQVDLPGVLSGVQIHDGAPHGPAQRRVAVIQNHAARTWAVTAAMTHPGIGMSDAAERGRQGAGLADLLDIASRTELISELLFVVRTVPEDGAERQVWIARHRRPGGPVLSQQVNDELRVALSQASVRTEAFVTVVVPEARIRRAARECGGGLVGRVAVLYGVMGEIEAQLRGAMAMTSLTWLTSPQLAAAVRTGFAPAERAGIIDAAAAHEADPGVAAQVPWAMAGPSGAEALVRHYTHDAWSSVSATLTLPARGAAIGALAPALTPSEPGERRCAAGRLPDPGPLDRRSGQCHLGLGRRHGHPPAGPGRGETACRATPPGRHRARDGRQTRPRQRDEPPLRGRHRHRPGHGADQRVRAAPGCLDPPGRVRPAAVGPGPGRRVRRVLPPAGDQLDPGPTMTTPSSRGRGQGGAGGEGWPACWTTSATSCRLGPPNPSRSRRRACSATHPAEGSAGPGGDGRRRVRRCRRGG